MQKTATSLIITALCLSACNLPVVSQMDPQIATSAAQTVQAALATPLASPAGTSAVISAPKISVGDVTNCRSGPGTNYERVAQLTPGQPVDVVGVLPPSYWIVKTNSGTCWVSAEFATPMGSVQLAPTVAAPPSPTGEPPQHVGFQHWNIACNYATGAADITLIWTDRSSDESGYRVIRNGSVIAELPPDSTTFSETITLLSGQTVGYSVEVFNTIGTARSNTIPLAC